MVRDPGTHDDGQELVPAREVKGEHERLGGAHALVSRAVEQAAGTASTLPRTDGLTGSPGRLRRSAERGRSQRPAVGAVARVRIQPAGEEAGSRATASFAVLAILS